MPPLMNFPFTKLVKRVKKKFFFLNQSFCCYSKEDVYLIEAHPQVEPSNEQILRFPVTVFIKHRHSQNHNYLGYKRSKKAI